MTPYGYTIRNARAEIDPEAQTRITRFYQCILEGMPLKTAAREAEVDRTYLACMKILKNPVYLGTDFYPPLLAPSLFRGVQAELKRREGLGPAGAGRKARFLPVYTEFTVEKTGDDASGLSPRERARRLYEGIQVNR